MQEEEHKLRLGKMLHHYAQVMPFGYDFTSEKVIHAWFGHLKEIPLKAVYDALERCVGTMDRFPTISHIKALAGQGEDSRKIQAEVIAGKVIEAMRKFGSYREKDAFEHMGKEGETAVARMGGWHQLCETTKDDNLTHIMHNLRAQVESILASQGLLASGTPVIGSQAEEGRKAIQGAVTSALEAPKEAITGNTHTSGAAARIESSNNGYRKRNRPKTTGALTALAKELKAENNKLTLEDL